MGNSDRKPGLIKRLWKWWRTPSRLALGTLLLIGFCWRYCLLGRL